MANDEIEIIFSPREVVEILYKLANAQCRVPDRLGGGNCAASIAVEGSGKEMKFILTLGPHQEVERCAAKS